MPSLQDKSQSGCAFVSASDSITCGASPLLLEMPMAAGDVAGTQENLAAAAGFCVSTGQTIGCAIPGSAPLSLP